MKLSLVIDEHVLTGQQVLQLIHIHQIYHILICAAQGVISGELLFLLY